MSDTKVDEKERTNSTTSVNQDASSSDIDLLSYHEKMAGSLIVDPAYVFRSCILLSSG